MTDTPAAPEKENHALSNAKGWLAIIKEQVAKLERAEDGAEPSGYVLKIEGQADQTFDTEDEAEAAAEALSLDDYEVVPVEGGEEIDADDVRQEIQEGPLSVQVRNSQWRSPGEMLDPEDNKPDEFEILLSTGGPALRLFGDLGAWGDPTDVKLQHQDWGTPWTDYDLSHDDEEIVLTWCRVFYFGD